MNKMASSGALALITCMLALASCGFEPLHGEAYRASLAVDLSSMNVVVKGSSGNVATNSVATVPTRYGELLKAEIDDRTSPMGDASEKLFTLAIDYSETDAVLFVNPDGTASRGDLVYTSTYIITRRIDAEVVATGTLRRTSSYNTSPTATYAGYVAREDARKRGILELAQDYKLRLATLLPTLNNPKAKVIGKRSNEQLPELQPVRNYETLRPGY